MIFLVIWMGLPKDKQLRPGDAAEGAHVPLEETGEAGSAPSEAGPGEEGQVLGGKFKVRPGPEEREKLRYERKRRELVERLAEMKTRYLDSHPAVRRVAEELEKLDAEQGGEAGR